MSTFKSTYTYTFEKADGSALDWSTQDYLEAEEYAQHHRYKIIENVYKWTTSVIADFTGVEKEEEC